MGAYIFLGPELGKKNEALAAVRKKFPGAEETVFYAGETNTGTITDVIQNHSLFAASRIFIIKNAELLKNSGTGKKSNKTGDVDLLVSCIKNLDRDTALILLSDETRISADFDDAVPRENRQVFYELFEREKTEWLRSYFRSEGFSIDHDGIETILEMVENNTDALRRECSRLVCFLPKDKPVSAEAVEKWLSHNREESTFTLFSRIAAGDLGKTLESVRALLAAKESAQSILVGRPGLAGLIWCWRKLQDYHMLTKSGDMGYSELKKIGLGAPKTKDDYAAAARRYTPKAAEACLALTAMYDCLLRSPVAVMEDILMDRYIVGIYKLAC